MHRWDMVLAVSKPSPVIRAIGAQTVQQPPLVPVGPVRRRRADAEAIVGLKPQEIHRLLLETEVLSYQEICEAAGIPYKRFLTFTDARFVFLSCVARIGAGRRVRAARADHLEGGRRRNVVQRNARVRPDPKVPACKAPSRILRRTPRRMPSVATASSAKKGPKSSEPDDLSTAIT
jgi:hypothetical protein